LREHGFLLVDEQLDGTFTSATNVSGTVQYGAYTLDCGTLGSLPVNAESGTFTGTAG